MPTPAPIREQILAALTAAVSGTYAVDAPVSEREVPITVLLDGEDEALADYDCIRNSTPVSIARVELACSTDKTEQRQQAHRIMAAIIQEVAADETLGGLAEGIDYNGGSISVDVGKFVFGECAFTVRWNHLRGNPFANDYTLENDDSEPEPDPEEPEEPEEPIPEP